MTSFFPDLNVWIALSVSSHPHRQECWQWLDSQPGSVRLIFSRFTQVGFIRLLTNRAVMGECVMTLRDAWHLYDQWLGDPRAEFLSDPRGLEKAFRESTSPLADSPASNQVGDCLLLALAKVHEAPLVSFDKALLKYAAKHGYPVITPSSILDTTS